MKKSWPLVCVFLLAALLVGGCQKKEAPKVQIRPIRVAEVGSVQTLSSRWFPGKAAATQEANLAFRVSGTLMKFPVDIGDVVKKGALLAQLDPRDYQVELENARAQVRKVQADLALAKAEYLRVENIWKKDSGAVSQSMLDTRRGNMTSIEAQLNSAQASVLKAQDKLRYSSLRAPFEGIVVEKFVENFEDVNAKQKIVRLVDTTKIEMTVQIPETMISQAYLVKNVYVVFDANPDVEIKAKIKEIGKEASLTTRTYPVTLTMDQPEKFKILPGMAGKARADHKDFESPVDEQESDYIEIPLSAIFANKEDSFVWIVDSADNTVHQRQVEVGSLTDNGVLVKGVKKGDIIATAGVNTLVEGQKIRIIK
jgi:RND family efflux transporter MFP subunit